jgi:hypothetical protein
MTMNVFVPLTDEILYQHPDLFRNGLVPYRTGLPCFHWLKDAEVEIEYANGRREAINELANVAEVVPITEHAA